MFVSIAICYSVATISMFVSIAICYSVATDRLLG